MSFFDSMFVLYIKLHHLINHKLEVKHIIHFAIGVLAGVSLLYVGIIVENIPLFVFLAVIFAILNSGFHAFFQDIPETKIVIKMEDGEDMEEIEDKLKDSMREFLEQEANEEAVMYNKYNGED